VRLQPECADLDKLMAERGDQLVRAAIALAGNRADGEDLLQAALERLLRSRHRVESDLEGYPLEGQS
jgi:DNA-directed RNA polymerase specialized sigma24 family protein